MLRLLIVLLLACACSSPRRQTHVALPEARENARGAYAIAALATRAVDDTEQAWLRSLRSPIEVDKAVAEHTKTAVGDARAALLLARDDIQVGGLAVPHFRKIHDVLASAVSDLSRVGAPVSPELARALEYLHSYAGARE